MTPPAPALLAATGGTVALIALGIAILDPGAGTPLLTAAALATLGVLGGAAPGLIRPAARAAGRIALAAVVSAAVLGSGALLVIALLGDRRPVAAAAVALVYVAAAAAIRTGLLDGGDQRPPRAARRPRWSVERTPPPLTRVMPRVQMHMQYGPVQSDSAYTRVRGVA